MTVVPNFIAALCFYRAGIYYEQVKIKQKAETDAVVEKAEEAEISVRHLNDSLVIEDVILRRQTLYKQRRRPA